MGDHSPTDWPATMPLRAADLAARTGLTPRFFQKLAKSVYWATQPNKHGAILFDEDGFKAWLAAILAVPRPLRPSAYRNATS